ncbi:EAL domain-containing protein [Waterburya agarophytonicola K14]|uniref:EAL domain-containing protein n=1 Tax=Waterburya agarophytonicola KI4 TaxID=2874699 RepID=A0A964BTK1_9CYAN|nr:EAL domain-containing protein [Waterburya agarophytonicola]MCC0178006.1 EAL domain-containing protein [Waterburya agarophytonicola KI4]
MKAYNKFARYNDLGFKKVKKKLGTYTLSLFLLTILITTIVLVSRYFGSLQVLELLVYDWMVNLHNKNEIDSRFLVVEITDKDIQKQNSWPISDETIAQVLKNLQKHQPKVIGFDLYREVPYPPGTKALQQELQRDNVVVIQLIGNGDNSVAAPPGVKRKQIGFNDVVLDIEGDVLRRNLMYVQFGDGEDEQMSSFSLQLSLKYLREQNLRFQVERDFLQIGNTIFPDLKANSGGYRLESSETAGKQILIDYRSPNIAKTVTLGEVLAGKVDPNLIKDKIVLIGTSAPSIKDIIPTPYRGSQTFMPGVIAHAQMTSQILSVVLDDATLIWFWSEGVEGVWIWVWSLLGVAIAWKLKHPLLIAMLGIVSIVALWSICLIVFAFSGWIPFVPAAIALAATAVSVLGYKSLYNLFYDSLTGLPNRTLFAKQLKELKQRNRLKSEGYIAILCLDLDRFKLINDGLGYQAGDRILIATAQRLQDNLDSKAILARVGADEFAIAFRTNEDTGEAISVANTLDRELAIPFQLKEQEVFTSASIGLALNRMSEDFQPEELLQASHTAMYKAKVSGKSQHQVFATKMHEQALKRLQLEADLNQAIANEEFELYYQPIISFTTGKITGFEALVRWISPTRGFISPGDFIPVAEETGLIVPMGKWILETACRQMQSWRSQFPEAEQVTMSVNLSSRQFSQADLVAQIQETLIVTELDPANLKLEITESMVMDDVENTIILLNELKELNIKISLDDFGTGFSSFSYLHRFPTDTLKIDRSFVSNMSQGSKNIEIVNTIVILAHKLGMDVIAEGIETVEEKEILAGFNCEYAQGYFFAKPLKQDDATELFVNKAQW